MSANLSASSRAATALPWLSTPLSRIASSSAPSAPLRLVHSPPPTPIPPAVCLLSRPVYLQLVSVLSPVPTERSLRSHRCREAAIDPPLLIRSSQSSPRDPPHSRQHRKRVIQRASHATTPLTAALCLSHVRSRRCSLTALRQRAHSCPLSRDVMGAFRPVSHSLPADLGLGRLFLARCLLQPPSPTCT